MNAHKFAFQDLYILDLKPTTRTHWHSWGKLMDNRKYLKEAFPFTVLFFSKHINNIRCSRLILNNNTQVSCSWTGRKHPESNTHMSEMLIAAMDNILRTDY